MKRSEIAVGLLLSTYNWPEALEAVLQSIVRQTRPPQEVLIADDGSGEDTQRIVKKFRKQHHLPIKHFWQEDRGFRKSIIVNKAMKFATSSYIIQIDGDIVLHPRFVEDHVKAARKNWFVQGCRTILDNNKTREILAGERSRIHFLANGIRNRINAMRFPLLSPLIRTNPLSSKNIKACNLAFWKDDYIAVNGYDNLFLGWGWEDEEFAARLIHAGIRKKRLKLAAVCYHLNHALSSRSNIEMNQAIYNETIVRRRTFTPNGLAQV